jgi:hypothetical protein
MMKRYLLLSVLICTAGLGQGVHYYPYDDCQRTTHRLSLGPGNVELRRAKADLLPAYVAGCYKGVFDLTAGYTLHLFPDGAALLESWCDISSPEIKAEGKWKIQGDSVQIDWTKKRLDPREKEFFTKYHGVCNSLILYLGFDGQKIERDVYLVSIEKDGEKIEAPLWRMREYVDWQKIQNDLRKNRG